MLWTSCLPTRTLLPLENPVELSPLGVLAEPESGERRPIHETIFKDAIDSNWKENGNAATRFSAGALRIDTSQVCNGKGLAGDCELPASGTYRLTVVAGYSGDSPKQELDIGFFNEVKPKFTGTRRAL